MSSGVLEFSTATSDVSLWSLLPAEEGTDASSGTNIIPAQVVRLICHSSATGAAATLGLALVDLDATTHKVIARYAITVTANGGRTGYDNASGNYTCDVQFPEGQTSKFDLLGHSEVILGHQNKLKWYLGMTAAGGLGTVTAVVRTTRTI